MSEDPPITIVPEVFGAAIDVVVIPPPMGIGHDREFPDRAGALAYALQLQKATGWRLVDHCGADE